MLRLCLALPLLAALALPAAAQPPGPQPPCAGDGEPAALPAYAPADATPAVAVWHDIELSAGQACGGRLQGRIALAAALSATFRFAGTLDELAARAGAISKTVGLVYWSTSEQKWRDLVDRASALKGPDGDWSDGAMWRPDFSAQEVRSGETLWFMQNDTRSTGANLYRLRALGASPDRLMLEVINESPISFTFVTLFGEHELLTLQSVEHLGGDRWGYYSLSAVRDDTFEGYEKSLLNREAALFRFLQGKPGDSEPPLAK